MAEVESPYGAPLMTPQALRRHGTPSQRTMDRETLRQLLEWAEGQVHQAERFVAKHRMLVATLERAKGDTAEARRLLAQLELWLEVNIAERNALRWELGE